jgi:hypothetical protein
MMGKDFVSMAKNQALCFVEAAAAETGIDREKRIIIWGSLNNRIYKHAITCIVNSCIFFRLKTDLHISHKNMLIC